MDIYIYAYVDAYSYTEREINYFSKNYVKRKLKIYTI